MRRRQLFTVVALLSVLSFLSMAPLDQCIVSRVEKPRQGTASKNTAPGRSREKKKYLFEDDEENLPENFDFGHIMDNALNCSRPFVRLIPGGQLGNQMCEASHMIAFKLKYKVQVGIPKDMRERMLDVFPNFPLPHLPEECLKRTDGVLMKVWNAEDYISLNGLDIVIIISGYPCQSASFVHYRSLLKFFYQFHDSVQQSAERYRDLLLDKWRRKMEEASLTDGAIQAPGNERPLVIGVHVRRTDYKRHMRKIYDCKVVLPVYFHDAFKFARNRYGKVAFFVVSDDLSWCHENIVKYHPDAVAFDDPISRDEDLALMALSDHLIFDLGSFALWGGLLAKGEIIYASNVSYVLSNPYKMAAWIGEARYEKFIPFLYRKPYQNLTL